jgi:hypothetical protein
MKRFFHTVKKIITNEIKTVTLDEFKEMLLTNRPTEIYNSFYSSKVPCWYITQYDGNDSVWFYAHSSADKTPHQMSIDRLYNHLCIQGLKNCYFK